LNSVFSDPEEDLFKLWLKAKKMFSTCRTLDVEAINSVPLRLLRPWLDNSFSERKATAAIRNSADGKSAGQVKLPITNNAFCIVQRATAQSTTGIFRDYFVAEAPPGFQAGWSGCMYFSSLLLFILFSHLAFPWKFLYS
jgi:hypothetical protein